MPDTGPTTLLSEVQQVLSAGLCVGCGACAFAAEGAIRIERSRSGACVAQVAREDLAAAYPGGVCPFSDSAPDEDEHGAALFGAGANRVAPLGYVRSAWAGYAATNAFRDKGSSGGITSWLLCEAMKTGEIDAVIHVHASTTDDLFTYSIARSVEDIRQGAKTRYYSVHFDEALAKAKEEGLRFALVAVPCFIKAARNLALQDETLRERARLMVSLVCGHMKSAGFAESLAWQAGVPPQQIAAFDFRVKLPGRNAQQYGISVTRKDTDEVITAPMGKMAGRRWDGGYHRLKACDFCDDVFGETADITFGDAWLPEYAKDPAGTNVIVVRSALAETLLQAGRDSGELTLDRIPYPRAIASQSGGLRDRGEGLAYRLHLADTAGNWHPRKRIAASASELTALRKLNFRLRQIVRDRSAANLVMCKRLHMIWPYRAEMSMWHAAFRALQIIETGLPGKARTSAKPQMKPVKTVLFSYQLLSNIGCEIIVRGTMAFVTRAFPDHEVKFVIASYHVARDREILSDVPNVEIVPMLGWKRIARGMLIKSKLNRWFWTPRFATEHFRKADLFVSVGGDIYTMFGDKIPEDWLGYERFATAHGIPAIMFGANMERFEVVSPAARKRLIAHLKRFRLIAVRDVRTRDYLARHGVAENIEVFPDPIFSLRPTTKLSTTPIRTVGLNVSPYVRRVFDAEGVQNMARVATAIVEAGYALRMIPHVYDTARNPQLDDRVAIDEMLALVPEALRSRIEVYDGPMSLRDMAREIDRTDLFIGARMHACLNATTLGKPVFFLGYSRKAEMMVHWLQEESPFKVARESLTTAMIDSVGAEEILTFIARQQEIIAARKVPEEINTRGFLDQLQIWRKLAERIPSQERRK